MKPHITRNNSKKKTTIDTKARVWLALSCRELDLCKNPFQLLFQGCMRLHKIYSHILLDKDYVNPSPLGRIAQLNGIYEDLADKVVVLQLLQAPPDLMALSYHAYVEIDKNKKYSEWGILSFASTFGN